MSLTKEINIDMVPNAAVMPIIHLSQYDDDFTLKFHLFSSNGALNIASGTTAAIRGTKSDGNGFSATATLSGTDVTVTGDPQMTVVAGKQVFELTLYNGSKKLSTANFLLDIERSALDKDTPTSKSQTRELVEIEDNADEIIGAADSIKKDKAAMEKTIADAKSDMNKIAKTVKGDADSANAKSDQALEKAGNAENETAETTNTIAQLKDQITQLQVVAGSHADELEVDSKGLVYLLNNGERIAGPYGPFAGNGRGGGGGEENNATMTVSNATGWLSKTVSEGSDIAVQLTWSSTEDDMPTGDGTLKVTVNNAVRLSQSVKQGTVTVDLSKLLSVGANVVKVNIADIYGNSRTVTFSIQQVELKISSTFDTSTPYTGAIPFTYTPEGNVAKVVHFLVDGKEIGTANTSVSGRQMSYTIAKQKHGAHNLECYFTAQINGEDVESNHLKYAIICLEDGVTTPIIVCTFDQATVSQYQTLHINYKVYDPANMNSPVTITVNGNKEAELTVDRTEQVFNYRADDVGQLSIVIATGDVSKTVTTIVEETKIDAKAETDALALYLTSNGRSNNEENPSEWKSGSIAAKLTGFNFVSDGWVNDSEGITALRVSGDARVEIPSQPFASDFRSTGKTIEIEFATHYVRNYDTPIISCMSGDRGIELTAQLAKLKSEQSELDMQYKEDEHVRVSFVIQKRAENRLMEAYVNGVMSGAVQYPDSDDFSQVNPVNITIGSSDCTTDVYCIRVYDNDLTRTQVLNNWMADTQNLDELLERYARNNIYDEYGSVTINKLPSDLPYMIITCPELPQYKGDKKTVEISYTDPVNASKSFTATNVQADVQGTSSQYYRRKNYKLKFKSGFEMTEDSTHEDKYSLRTGAIPESTFCMKADVASSEGTNNVELVRLYNDTCPYKTPAQQKNKAVRQGIDGFPCVIFWNDGNNTTFLGKYNFNNDKSDEKTFGFVEGDESWEVLNNTSQRVLWKSDDFESTVTDDSGNVVPAWLNDFEARYPDEDPAYTDGTQLKALATFLKSTDRTQTTGEALTEPITYDGVQYTKDDAEYRLAKFKAEVGNYIELQSAEYYYLFTEMFLMVDSRAKNMFPSFMGSEVN